MSFNNIVGQKKVTEILKDSMEKDRLGHAYLFYGADGIGKFTIASEFTKLIMCTDNHQRDLCKPVDTCMKCEACLLNKNQTNPDLKIIDVPSGKASIGVDAIRAVQEDVITAPLYSKKKIYIIRHSEKMTAEAQNVLLKTLEEPPLYVVIILLCSNISLLLDTVRSRVSRLDFARYTDDEIRKALEDKHIDAGEDKIVFIYADGIIGRAISYFNDEQIDIIRTELMGSIASLSTGGSADRLKCAKYITGLKDNKEFVFFTLMSFYRDIAQYARYNQYVKIQNRQQTAFISKQAENIGFYKAEECLGIIDKTWKRLKQNVNYDLAVNNMLIKIQEVLND